MSWATFAAIFAAFFLTHSIPTRPAVKARIVAQTGVRGFAMGYSALSLGMLALLIWAAGQAPYVQLWPQAPWQRHVVHLGMLAACLITAFGLARPNPFSFGGARNEAFDPAQPGLIRLMHHPILNALALWALMHLLVNGDLAHALLFGTLGLFAVLGRLIINLRKRRELGPERWQALASATRAAPLLPRPLSWSGFAIRLAAGFAAFALLLALHAPVIGVSPL